jgi:hypothetical protein
VSEDPTTRSWLGCCSHEAPGQADWTKNWTKVLHTASPCSKNSTLYLQTDPKCYTLHLRVQRTVLCTCKLIQELNQAEGEADDEGVDEMAGTRAVLQKCILILFRRLDETWPCLMCWGGAETGCITAKPCSCIRPSEKGRRTIIDFWSGNLCYLTISPAHASGVALRL